MTFGSNDFRNDKVRIARLLAPSMKLPNNVVWFELLLYLSLTLDALSVAFQDRSALEGDLLAPMILEAGLILLLVYFVHLAAQKRKNWPRWVLTALLVLSVFSLLPVLAENGIQLDSGIELLSCILTAVGLYCSYTGDAKGWFNA
jgi:heme/copper-type cytochrome/quinol oxidase subunit 4